MDISKMSLSEFMCEGNAKLIPEPRKEVFDSCVPIIEEFGVGTLLRRLRTIKGDYAIHALEGQPGDVVLRHKDESVGCYISDTLAVHWEHKGHRLGAALILAAAPSRPAPASRQYNRGGKFLLEMAWNISHGKMEDPWQ